MAGKELTPLIAPPNVGSMSPGEQAEFINRPEHWVFRARVIGVRLAFNVMSTPFAVAAMNTILDGVLSGQPAFRLERDEGMRPTPEFEDLLNQEYKPFAREALKSLFALGFTPIKIHPDFNTGFKTPIVPPFEDCEYHVIQNRITGKHELRLFDTRNGKYDESVKFVIESMPTVEGILQSRASSLFDIFQMMMTKLHTSNALDMRATLGDAWVRTRAIDNNALSSEAAARMSVYDIQQGAEPIQTRTTRQQLEEQEQEKREGPAQVRSFVVPSVTGPRAIHQIDANTEFINTHTSIKQSDDLAKAQDLFKTSLISVLNLPPALFEKNAPVHGKGLEELDDQTNEVIEAYARQVQTLVQTGYDMSYAIDDEKVLRGQLERFYIVQQQKNSLNRLQLLLQLQQSGMTSQAASLFAATSQQLVETKFVTDEEYASMVYEQRVRVVVSYNIRVSVARIYELVERGTIDDETGHAMVLRSLRLGGDVLDISHQGRIGTEHRRSVRDTNNTRSTSSRSRQRTAATQRESRREKQRDRRSRGHDFASASDTR